MPTYVAHVCRNKKCNVIWIDKDLTHATSTPPSWKYCEECAAMLGIDYETQTPTSNLTEKEIAHKNKLRERMKKVQAIRIQKLNLNRQEVGRNESF